MPLLHISLRDGKPEAYRRTICDGLYRVMRETLAVPEDDQFMIVTEHEAANFRYGNAYGVTRSDDLVRQAERARQPSNDLRYGPFQRACRAGDHRGR